MRINKFLAECGVASRRGCDKLIEEGKVLVNGKSCHVGMAIDEKRDVVTVDGQKVILKSEHKYYMMNKPKGYVCTVKDDKGRKTVMDLLPPSAGRVYPVGRLDYDSEGMLLFTDDGDFAFRLTHPKNEISKTYLVRIEGSVTEEQLNKLRSGVILDGKRTGKSKIRIVETDKNYTKLHVTIGEGRNRQVRRMFECIGKTVAFLKRIRIGEMPLGSLERGKVRSLNPEEIFYFKNL